MAEQSLLAKLGLRTGTVGSSGSLAIAFGNSGGSTPSTAHTAANRTGFYAGLSAGSELVALIVGGQVGPVLQRSGTNVNMSVTGTIAATGTITAQNGGTVGVALVPQGGAANFVGSMTTVLLTGNRTYTFPDADVIISGSSGALGTNQNIPYTTSTGLLQTAAGLIVVGTPSATAPSTATNGPGTINGLAYQLPDSGGGGYSVSEFGNGVAQLVQFAGFVCQGTAAAPGATIQNDGVQLELHGYTGSAFTTPGAAIALRANSTWSGTNRESIIQFATTPNGSTTLTAAGRIDPNQTLVWGGGVNGVGTFSAGTLRPHIQTASTVTANASIAQTMWNASAAGPIGIFAKSRSGTVGTQGVITTGDTLGTISWQGDDGTNFIAAAQIVGIATGTIGTGQVPGILRFQTASSAGTMTTAMQIESGQNIIVGNTTTTAAATYTGGTVTPRVQIKGTTDSTTGEAIARFSANASGPTHYFAKSRSGTIDTMTIVQTNDILGTISFQGADGTNFVEAAQIVVTATGTPASGVMPGQVVIKTANSAGTLTAAQTIDNAQKTTFNGVSPVVMTQTAASSGSPNLLVVTGAAHTNLTASTECITVNYNLTALVTFAAGAITTQRAFVVQAPSYAFASASTITTAATLSITNAPTAGTNATITNAWALLVEAGNVKIAATTASTSQTSGALVVGGGVGITGSVVVGTNVNISGVLNMQTSQATTVGTLKGINGIMTASPAADSSASYINYFMSRITTNHNLTATRGLVGAQCEAWNSGTLTVTGACAITTQVLTSTTGTITTAIGMNCLDASKFAGSTITTQYGIKIEDMSSATTNYAIVTGIGAVVFGDRQYLNAPNSAPTDGNIPTSAVSWYLDESGNNILVRVRYSDGITLKTGTVALV